jgi:hypothetical protein
MTDESDASDRIAADLAAQSDVQARASVITASQTIGDQQFAYADVQIRVDEAAHKRAVEQQKLDHALLQESKDNDLRRRVFWLVVTLLLIVLAVSAAVGIGHDDEETRRWAQNVVTTMIGGLLGAIAGYLTAKANKCPWRPIRPSGFRAMASLSPHI